LRTADIRSRQILWMSTLAFAACFAVWTIFSIIGIGIKAELDVNETKFGLLIATPILTGSPFRMPLGIWSDRYAAILRMERAVATDRRLEQGIGVKVTT
jgi:MFS transporter, NNP family, nitrate/nitrite transporter